MVELEVELIPVKKDYSGMLLMVLLYRLGLARTLLDATVLMQNGTAFVDGQPVRDLNYRIARKATIVVGLRGVELG